MLPPSSTMPGSHSGSLQSRAASDRGTASSSCQSSYLAQALKRQSVARDCRPARWRHEERAVVARPDAIGRGMARIRPPRDCAPTLSRIRARLLFQRRRSRTRIRTRSTRRKLAHDLAVDPRDGREPAGPVVAIVRPGDPGGLVRLPLGRHAEAGSRGVCGQLNRSPGSGSARRRRCGGRAGTASCGALPRCGAGSHSTISVSSWSCGASASTWPNGSATNDAPQNSRPCPGGPS